MIQLSNKIFCKNFLDTAVKDNKNLPNPYNDYPFLIIENFLTPLELQSISSSIQVQENVEQAKVKSQTSKNQITPTLVEDIRKTSLHVLPSLLEELYSERFLKHKQEIENFFSIGLTRSTPLQVLVYKEGDFYIKHADDSSELVNKSKETVGFTCIAPQRKLSSILFGTSHISRTTNDLYTFDGGELLFNYLFDKEGNPIVIYPKAGDMLLFFSNPFFSHEVKPVISGYRLSMVQWHDSL